MASPFKSLFTRSNRWRRERQLAGDGRVGWHAMREIRAQQRAWLRRHWRAELLLLGLTVGAVAAAHFVVPRAVGPYLIGGIVASAGWKLYVLMLQSTRIGAMQAGVDAETWTAAELRRLRRDGWRLVNHVMATRTDVDHALLQSSAPRPGEDRPIRSGFVGLASQSSQPRRA